MKNRKTKIKIKRSKVNLYNKKKNKTKQVIAIIVTAAAACALCILGYGIGKPLMDYFKNRGSVIQSSSMWTPESSENSGGESSENSSSGAVSGDNSTSSGSEEVPQPVLSNAVYYLSENAALSSESLNSELAAAKSSGHSIAAVTLKNSDGAFLYSSSIDKVNSIGTLSASQIASEIEKAGFIPAARISTLKDKTNGPALGCQFKFANGATWLDDRPGVGKTWLSPFDGKTLDFVKSITSELSQAGFKRIIAGEIMYPNFFPVDISTNLAHLPITDRTQRAQALWNVVAAAKEGAESGGAELFVEMDGAKLVIEKKDGTDAELGFSPESLKTANLIIDYFPEDSANAYTAAQEFAGQLKTALNGAECAVRITGNSSAAALESVKNAFDEAQIESFSQ